MSSFFGSLLALTFLHLRASLKMDASSTKQTTVAGGAGVDSSAATTYAAPLEAWQPVVSAAPFTKAALQRIQHDLKGIHAEALHGIVLMPDDAIVGRLHALVTGPEGTPYENGFFYFVVQCPPDYPNNPPKVQLMTTGGGVVRFNPNLYATGKVCLSILGTWTGPSWSPALSLTSVMLSIQSLMGEQPFLNEPGFEKCTDVAKINVYNSIVVHETIRVAVINNIKDKHALPPDLRDACVGAFSALVELYVDTCDRFEHLDGSKYADTFSANKGTYAFGEMKKTILELAAQLDGAEVPVPTDAC